MDLRQLAALAAVADAGSFSAAARRLHTVQSNVSTHVARLEHELGTTLVDRGTGALTEEGEVVVDRARRVHHELESLLADVQSMLHDVSGQVRLGCIGTVSRWLIPHLLQLMTDRHPRVRVVVVDATTTSLVPQLLGGSLDLAIVNLPLGGDELATEPLFDEQRILAAPFTHPLADREHIDLADLADHPLLLEPRGTPFRDELDQEAARRGVEVRAQAEIDGVSLLAWLAYEGHGAAILPATAAATWIERSCRRIAVGGLTPRSVGLAVPRRGRPSAPARAVTAVIRELVTTTDQDGVEPTLTP
ncbi:MAG TPA: LysR family transcriptional regulator [Acidimicrobiales bacterium]|jgi:DNA-binding transcriptional LysR family regulator|nr:LysR family transcriptional regulator [Acidimicrobiales bacterium]